LKTEKSLSQAFDTDNN